MKKMFLVVKLIFFVKDKGDHQKSQPRKRGVKSYENFNQCGESPKTRNLIYAETTPWQLMVGFCR